MATLAAIIITLATFGVVTLVAIHFVPDRVHSLIDRYNNAWISYDPF